MPWGVQTTLPLIYPYKNDRETVQNDDFPVRVGTFDAKKRLRQSDIMFIWPHCALLRPYTPPHALRASVSVLPGLIFSFYGHLDFKKD